MGRIFPYCCMALCMLLMPATTWEQTTPSSQSLRLKRALRPWEFLSATGQQSAFLGHEDGKMEAWVYPLKLLRDLHLIFHEEGGHSPGESGEGTCDRQHHDEAPMPWNSCAIFS